MKPYHFAQYLWIINEDCMIDKCKPILIGRPMCLLNTEEIGLMECHFELTNFNQIYCQKYFPFQYKSEYRSVILKWNFSLEMLGALTLTDPKLHSTISTHIMYFLKQDSLKCINNKPHDFFVGTQQSKTFNGVLPMKPGDCGLLFLYSIGSLDNVHWGWIYSWHTSVGL